MNRIDGDSPNGEASYKWGASQGWINQYCIQGRISGLTHFGRSWSILADAEKPSDSRKICNQQIEGRGER